MSDFWDREVIERRHVEWMAIPKVRLYLNHRIGGEKPLWPIELFEIFLGGRTFDLALSIGCGTGELERQLVQRGLCRSFDAFDGSIVSLITAKREAEKAGVGDRVRYFASDFNRPVLAHSRYDIVFFHQSAHHVARLEKLYRSLMSALKPEGMIYMDEYVGPSRVEWAIRRSLLDPHQRIFATIPPELRAVERLNPPIQMDDPSEAVRSSEIEPQLRIGFEILGRQPYGGGILSVILPNLRIDRLDDTLLEKLIAEDQRAPEFYTLIAAKPKSGRDAAIARARYWIEPKLKWPFRVVKRWMARLALARL